MLTPKNVAWPQLVWGKINEIQHKAINGSVKSSVDGYPCKESVDNFHEESYVVLFSVRTLETLAKEQDWHFLRFSSTFYIGSSNSTHSHETDNICARACKKRRVTSCPHMLNYVMYSKNGLIW